MSAPDTNIEKQTRWHRGPLIGMAVVVVFALGYGAYYLGNLAEEGNNPDNPDVIIDGRTGEAEEVQ
ncbi:MAG: hypothetical protein CMH12_16860 [Maritimibacter sp.]|nr:hypothetical protein [Maritimibacter sp.]